MAKDKDRKKFYTVRIVNPSTPGPPRRLGEKPAPASRNRNPANGSITIEEQAVLEDLSRQARESGDDWGIQQGIQEYLHGAYSNEAFDSPKDFLETLHDDVMWHYKHVGDDDDPEMDKASAKRAQASIGRAIKRLPKRKAPSRPPAAVQKRRSIHEVELAHGDETEFHGTFSEFMDVYGHDNRLLGSWTEKAIRNRLEEGGSVKFADGDVLRATKWSSGNPRSANPAPERVSPRVAQLSRRISRGGL